MIEWNKAQVEFFSNFSSNIKVSIIFSLYEEQFLTGNWDLTNPDHVTALEKIGEFSVSQKALSEALGEMTSKLN